MTDHAEVAAQLPGDDLLPRADRSTTRTVTIAAPAHAVWEWVAQMGQGRGGLYSYDVIENLLGCDMHSADEIVPAWQHAAVGEPFRLHPDIALRVAVVEPDRALVVRGGVPIGGLAPPYDFTWAFVVRDIGDGNTRLTIRERYRFERSWAALIVDPITVVSFVMTRKMLHGIRNRAERPRREPATPFRDPTRSTPIDRSKLDLDVPGVYLYWLPLGAGARVVRLSGRVFEAITARMQHRPRCDLYHSALLVVTPEARFVIEMTPVAGPGGPDLGVVAEGAVGSARARPFRIFRYAIHRWRGGAIADVRYAVESPVQLSIDPSIAEHVLALVLSVPTPVWGRDELHAGEMWNSNSVTSWLLCISGIDIDAVRPPGNGRAPGWDAGRVVASRI